MTETQALPRGLSALDALSTDLPARRRDQPIDERVHAPAERIRVADLAMLEQLVADDDEVARDLRGSVQRASIGARDPDAAAGAEHLQLAAVGLGQPRKLAEHRVGPPHAGLRRRSRPRLDRREQGVPVAPGAHERVAPVPAEHQQEGVRDPGEQQHARRRRDARTDARGRILLQHERDGAPDDDDGEDDGDDDQKEDEQSVSR